MSETEAFTEDDARVLAKALKDMEGTFESSEFRMAMTAFSDDRSYDNTEVNSILQCLGRDYVENIDESGWDDNWQWYLTSEPPYKPDEIYEELGY